MQIYQKSDYIKSKQAHTRHEEEYKPTQTTLNQPKRNKSLLITILSLLALYTLAILIKYK